MAKKPNEQVGVRFVPEEVRYLRLLMVEMGADMEGLRAPTVSGAVQLCVRAATGGVTTGAECAQINRASAKFRGSAK